MSHSPLRAHIAERMNLILGYYSSEDQVAHQFLPSVTNDPNPSVTAIHESIHRDLAVASELGFFEGLLGLFAKRQFAPRQFTRRRRVRKIKSVLTRLIAHSWQTHESAATYFSIKSVFGDDEHELSNYVALLPPDYQQAFEVYSRVFEDCQGDPLTIEVTCQLAKNISRTALDVPIIAEFKSFQSVTPKAISRFLRSHDPDQRQQQILDLIGQSGALSNLVNRGCSFLNENDISSTVSTLLSELERKIQLFSKLDLFLLRDLRDMFPQLVFTDIEQQEHVRGELIEHWRAEFEDYGIRVELDHFDPAEDATQEVDAMLDKRVEIGPTHGSYFSRRDFGSLSVLDVDKHVEALKRVGSDLLVSVLPFANKKPIKIGKRDTLPPDHVLLYTFPWQWRGDNRIQQISSAMKEDVYMRRSVILCPWENLSVVTATLSRVNTVWLREHKLEEIAVNLGHYMPKVEGLSFIYRTSSSAREILTSCSTLSDGSDLGIFVQAREGSLDTPEVLFVALVKQAQREVHLFPITIDVFAMILARLTERSQIRFWSNDEVRASGIGDILAEVVDIYFTSDRQIDDPQN